ncbi:hypothetical protein [Treponema saccharophilum]|uniref:hypothetical protein n=1 Tax=Treponema saccharophilum TaxID=165 RepID=UPI001C267F9C|nr:hypothetical protein [Treponema saccharophilum]
MEERKTFSKSLDMNSLSVPKFTAQHSTAQHSTAQHSTAQHSTAQHSTAQHSTAQHSTAQHSYNSARIIFSGYAHFKSNSQTSRMAAIFSLWKNAHDAGKTAPCTWAFHILNHISGGILCRNSKNSFRWWARFLR